MKRHRIWNSTTWGIHSRWPILFILILLLTGIFAPFIANNKPIVCKTDSGIHFPIFEPQQLGTVEESWKSRPCRWAVWPLIRFRAEDIDLLHLEVTAPFPRAYDRYGAPHYLGTDDLGRDVAAGLVHGTLLSVAIGLGAGLTALLIGVLLGILAGYWGNDQYHIPRVMLPVILLGFPLPLYWILSTHGLDDGLAFWGRWGISILFALAVWASMKWLSKSHSSMWPLPIERCILCFITLFSSIPGAFILLVLLSGILPPTLASVILIIGGLSWTRMANLSRAETLRVRRSNYVNNAKLMGVNNFTILRLYVLPSIWPSVSVHLIFVMISAIRLESTISFLGMGLNGAHVTWGSQLASARNNIDAWWLVLFPGGILFLTIYALHRIAQKALRGKDA